MKAPGEKIGERYEVQEAHQGTLTEVYRCFDHTEKRLLTLETPRDPKNVATFSAMAALWLGLGAHPNLVRCYRVEQIDSQLYLISEPISSSLQAIGRPLKLKQALGLAMQICRGLKHAADVQPGFVHRNLNPATILITDDMLVKIGSFDLANSSATTSPTDSVSDSSIFQAALESSPAFTAPEQWRGEQVDVRADIYAVGCLLYQMLTGGSPFSGDPNELRKHHLSSPVPPLNDDVPAGVNRILERCLQKQKDQRFPNAEALRKELSSVYREFFDEKPRKLSAASPLSPNDLFTRATSYILLQRYGAALADLQHVIGAESERSDAYTQRAIAYYGQRNYREALADAKHAISLNGSDGLANLWAARSLARRGELRAALPYFERAAELGISEAAAEYGQAVEKLQSRSDQKIQVSTAVQVARQRGAVEARRSNYEFLLPEHLLCGLSKLEDLIKPEAIKALKLPANVIPAFTGEVNQFVGLLKKFNIEARQLRRAMRVLLGDGRYQGDAGRKVSRSPESHTAFDRAQQIAQEVGAPIVATQHLLAALVDIENDRITELLGNLNIDRSAFYNAASTLPVSAFDSLYTPWLDQVGIDLTELAMSGKVTDAVGREEELLQVIRTLGRETKNNPVLVGEPGVGKTAIVEGLARRIVTRNIDPNFYGKRIIQISASGLVSDTAYRGQFEERMKGIIDEASEHPNIILFIDEIHMLVGAGLVEGSNMDAANILKPALSRGLIKLIGATTEAEYHQWIGKDAAFERRFQLIHVPEPNEVATRKILLAARERLQRHHAVRFRDDAIDAAIQLSVRYMPARRLPDKALDLLDEAGARVRYGNVNAQPDDSITTESGADGLSNEPAVTVDTIREVVAEKVGVPVARMTEDEAKRILQMPQALRERIVGQNQAVEAVATAIRRNYADLRSGKRPIAVFLFVGPSGVGKTELAKATANFLFGTDERMIRLDMSEYAEQHSVSRLVGSPPGYVGYDQGGQLTEALRKTPYAVVLLDEVEKAHPDVLNVFLQAFGEGRLTDGRGRTVDATNVIFMMTSNLGSYTPVSRPIGLRPADPAPQEESSGLNINAIKAAIRGFFRPELINRLDEIVVFQPLSAEHMLGVVRVHLKPVIESLGRRGITLEVPDDAVAWLAQHGQDAQFGARPLIRLIDKQITNEIGGLLLSGRITAGDTIRVIPDGEALKIEIVSAPK